MVHPASAHTDPAVPGGLPPRCSRDYCCAVDMNEFFARVEATLLAQFNEAQVVQHAGDRGENLETILSDVLRKRLPHRYGVVKGQVITSAGEASHSADLIIYDAIDCPVLYTEQTAVVPVEGVYGIVELKSRLSKGELV
jgi:hypothetical protein